MIKKIPPIKSQKGIERQYQKQLNNLGKALALGVREQVLNYLKAQQSSYVMDGFGDQLGVIFKKLNSIFTGVATASFAETTASQMVQKVGAASKNRFNRAVASATGVDLGSVIAAEGLEEFAAVSINKNVSLIKSLPVEYLKQVETIVNNGVVSGARYSTIEKEIISKTGANSKLVNRIKTIARNEVQTINSQIILRRSESLGITKGIYKSSKDERVRKSHAELDGAEFELKKGAWSKTAQKFIQPGITDINCRCSYSPIIKVDEEKAEKIKPEKKKILKKTFGPDIAKELKEVGVEKLESGNCWVCASTMYERLKQMGLKPSILDWSGHVEAAIKDPKARGGWKIYTPKGIVDYADHPMTKLKRQNKPFKIHKNPKELIDFLENDYPLLSPIVAPKLWNRFRSALKVAKVKASEWGIPAEKPVKKPVKKPKIKFDLNRTIKEWVGTEESDMSFEDFRFGKTAEAVAFRNAIKTTVIESKKRSYRGMVLSDNKIKRMLLKKEFNLLPIESFSTAEQIAQGFAKSAHQTSSSFGIKNITQVIFEVPELKTGLNISAEAGVLKGQAEILTTGKLKIKKSKKIGNILHVFAEHIPIIEMD